MSAKGRWEEGDGIATRALGSSRPTRDTCDYHSSRRARSGDRWASVRTRRAAVSRGERNIPPAFDRCVKSWTPKAPESPNRPP
eukprot:30918-Pelagococcus_subviridis.AAC.66